MLHHSSYRQNTGGPDSDPGRPGVVGNSEIGIGIGIGIGTYRSMVVVVVVVVVTGID